MPLAHVMRVHWSGFDGAPGISTFVLGNKTSIETPMTSAELTPAADALRALFNAAVAHLPNVVTLTWDGECSIYDAVTGTLTNLAGYTAPAPVQGTATTGYAAPVGGQFQWSTDVAVRGRILRGRTFLVPMGKDSYTTTGELASGAQSTLGTAAQSFLTSSQGAQPWTLYIWQRPFDGDPPNPDGSPGRAAYPGSMHFVESASVPTKTVVLTSRRD